MKKLMLAGFTVASLALSVQTGIARPWGEADCRAVCQRTAFGPLELSNCLRRNHCETYPKGHLAPAGRIEKIVKKWCKWNLRDC